MCYGSLDPKQMMRDMDARLGAAPSLRGAEDKIKTAPKAGLLAPLWLALVWWKRKDFNKV